MISVVIPSYNRAALLPRAIDSVLVQGNYASEIIVVDDGSTDNTREICVRYGPKIKYLWQENAGPSAARNNGAHHTHNQWIAFLDSDDYWTPDHLPRIVAAIKETNGAARFYFSDMQMGEGDGGGTLWETINFIPPRQVHLIRDGTNWAFLRHQPMMLQCSVFLRSVFMESGALDPRLRLKQDTELFFRLSIGGKVCAVSGVGCVYTSDDPGEFRLTTAVNPETPKYWEETILIYRELVSQYANLSPRYRAMARRSLASAHWRLGRLYWKSGKLGKTALQLPKVGSTDPLFALSLVAHGRSDANYQEVPPDYS